MSTTTDGASTEPPAAASTPVSPWQRPKTILKLLAIPATLVLIIVSTLLLGSTSHANPTGSVAGVVNAASEYLTLSGVDVSHVELAAEISTVDNHWARFEAEPSTPADALQFQGEYGYARFERRTGWNVVAVGSAGVGCASGGTAATVPAAVLAGFHETCPPA